MVNHHPLKSFFPVNSAFVSPLQLLPFPLDRLAQSSAIVEVFCSDTVLKRHCLVRERERSALCNEDAIFGEGVEEY